MNGAIYVPDCQTSLFDEDTAHFGEFYVLLVRANE